MLKPVIFYSEGVKLAGDLFLPADIKPGERRAGIVLCHGYTGVRSIYLPDNARVLAEAGLGIYGTSYGGATVVFVAAIDPRVKCVVSVVGIGNGARWMRSVRARMSTMICWSAPPRTVSSACSPGTPSLPTATTCCCRTASQPNWARRRGATIRRQ
jgi:hypothetical protein